MNEKYLAALRTELLEALEKLPQRDYVDDVEHDAEDDMEVWVYTVLLRRALRTELLEDLPALRTELLEALEKLPQREYMDDVDMEVWVDTVLRQAALRTELLEALEKLPQRDYVDDADMEVWVGTVLRQEPDRAWWHYNRLFGIGGSEIGVLLGAEEGKFHPFSSARDITRQKLMVQGLSKPNGDMARGTQMEPIARDIYRARVAARGGRAILDDELSAKLGAYKDPNHPWLVGNPDDIVEENGKIYIVDYKVPMPDQIKHYDQNGVPFYYEAQLHHYKLIAEKVGMKIDGLRLASLDLKAWDIDERDVPFNPAVSQQIIEVGDHYWNNYVMVGRVAPMVRLTKTSSLTDMAIEIRPDLIDAATGEAQIVTLDENNRNSGKKGETLIKPNGVMDVASEKLREVVTNYTEKFTAWRVLHLEAETMSEMFGEAVAQVLPTTVIPHNVDQIDAGVAQIKIRRVWNEDALLAEIRRLGVLAGNTEEQIDADLSGPNFMGDPTFDQKKLAGLVKKVLGVDVMNDERFASAIDKPAKRRLDTLVSLLRDLDVEDKVNWDALLETTPEVKVELTREPFTGPLNELRGELRETMRGEVVDMVNRVAPQYAERRAVTHAAVNASKPAKKSRSKAKAEAETVVITAETTVVTSTAPTGDDLAAVFEEAKAPAATGAKSRKPR